VSEFILDVTPEVEVEVKAAVPTGARNGWRNITFYARFEPLSQTDLEESGVTVKDAMRSALKSVDFGTLKLKQEDAAGNALSPREVALGNIYTHNALLAAFRDQVLTKNIEGKASRA
jgi:hypothetical protein